jgi:hypothetical protein
MSALTHTGPTAGADPRTKIVEQMQGCSPLRHARLAHAFDRTLATAANAESRIQRQARCRSSLCLIELAELRLKVQICQRVISVELDAALQPGSCLLIFAGVAAVKLKCANMWRNW